jgi:uncharacterized protein YjbI with pentapeptide repeats
MFTQGYSICKSSHHVPTVTRVQVSNYDRGLYIMRNIFFLGVVIFAISCSDEKLCNSDLYRYQVSTGKCVNCRGEEGLNGYDESYIESTKDAECFNLRGRELILLHREISMPWSLAYDTLEGYNFRGADLDTAILYFNKIHNADLRGTNLSTLRYGYAVINGAIDQFTKLPENGDCDVSASELECFQ